MSGIGSRSMAIHCMTKTLKEMVVYMANAFDASIERLMNLDIGSSFIWNDNVLCVIKDRFSDWHKDCNSPAKFSEASINIKAGSYEIPGLISVQRDPMLSQKYYATLYIKQANENRWQSMFTINKITFI